MLVIVLEGEGQFSYSCDALILVAIYEILAFSGEGLNIIVMLVCRFQGKHL